MKKINKRISFDEYDAVHIYEYLRFYWEEEFLEDPTWREAGRFGGCPQCIHIGERLEKFIGEEEIKEVEKYLRKYRKEYKQKVEKVK
ncbi:hypothetical protein KKF82_04480 [Patescibacteria group bacterium]|nr:hypothetical protein [Patescibacteria group bacterium]